ncbi:archease [Candidatus Pacearchaeota archaeon]|nr:archease [Candidatus Pacearchaeota archaeon]
MKFKFLPHTADVKFQAYGKTLEEVFENSVLALINRICSDKIESREKIKFKVKGRDLEALMYNFLEEFLYLVDAKQFLASEVKVKIKNKKELEAEILGDSSEEYALEMHIKAITYNEMFVKEISGKWVAQVVLDV